MSTIRYRITDEVWDEESMSIGEPEYISQESEHECDIRTMFELLRNASPSQSSLGKGTWFSDYEFNHGTRSHFEDGVEIVRNYFPVSERDEKWMKVAWKMSHRDYANRHKAPPTAECNDPF